MPPCVSGPEPPEGLKTLSFSCLLSETPSLRHRLHKGSPVLPVLETVEKIGIKKGEYPFEMTKPSLFAQKPPCTSRSERMCGLYSAPTHSRSSSRTHACPVLLTEHLPQQLSNRSYFTPQTQRDECPQLLYDAVRKITPLVQDQLCVGGGQHASCEAAGDKQPLL